MAEILLVRHAQSTWNAEHRWAGQADPPLTPQGEVEAVAAAKRLATHGFSAVVASDLDRARRTAEIVAAELGIGDVLPEAGFRERGAGEWTGLTREQIEERYAISLDEHHEPPGAEPWGLFTDRVVAACSRLGRRFRGRRVLAVAHGGVIWALIEHLGVQHDGGIPNLAGRWFTLGGGTLRAGDLEP